MLRFISLITLFALITCAFANFEAWDNSNGNEQGRRSIISDATMASPWTVEVEDDPLDLAIGLKRTIYVRTYKAIYCYSSYTGKLLWNTNTAQYGAPLAGGAPRQVIGENGWLYVVVSKEPGMSYSRDVTLLAIDTNGNVIWHQTVPGRGGYADGCSPVVSSDQGKVFIAPNARGTRGGSIIYAFDWTTGAAKGKAQANMDEFQQATVDNGHDKLYIPGFSSNPDEMYLFAFDLNLNLLWKSPIDATSNAPIVDSSGSTVFVSTEYVTGGKHVYAFDTSSGNQKWAFQVPSEADQFSDWLMLDSKENNVIFAGSPSGWGEKGVSLIGISTYNGQIAWKTVLDSNLTSMYGCVFGPPAAIGDGRMILPVSDGLLSPNNPRLLVMSESTGKESTRVRLPSIYHHVSHVVKYGLAVAKSSWDPRPAPAVFYLMIQWGNSGHKATVSGQSITF